MMMPDWFVRACIWLNTGDNGMNIAILACIPLVAIVFGCLIFG